MPDNQRQLKLPNIDHDHIRFADRTNLRTTDADVVVPCGVFDFPE